MLVDRATAASRDHGDDRLGSATKAAARATTRVFVPKNLDRDLPGRKVAHGFNVGLTPVLFAAIGYGIDRLVGTVPVFTIALALLSIVGVLTSSWYRYKAQIEAEEVRASAVRAARAGGGRHRSATRRTAASRTAASRIAGSRLDAGAKTEGVGRP